MLFPHERHSYNLLRYYPCTYLKKELLYMDAKEVLFFREKLASQENGMQDMTGACNIKKSEKPYGNFQGLFSTFFTI